MTHFFLILHPREAELGFETKQLMHLIHLMQWMQLAGRMASREDVVGRLSWKAPGSHGPCQRPGGIPAAADLQQVVRAGLLGQGLDVQIAWGHHGLQH